jgi:FAD/FMN-containing dehydrogenase
VNPSELISALRALTGAAHVLEGPDTTPYVTEWRGRFRGDALCVAKPADRDQVAAIVRLCAQHRTPLLPQGGNTSMSGGSVPAPAGQGTLPVVLNLARMRRIRQVDALNHSVEADAGCTVAEIQAAAEAVDRLYGVSFGAEGSAQIGGSVATNAGGTGVLRYGNTRENVLGLEVVLPDGSIWEGLRTLRKDNTGYDLKQLFIGSEGTLGVITAVALKLHPRPNAQAMAWVAPHSLQAALSLLALAQQQCGTRLNAFEVLNRTQIEHVLAHVPGVHEPLAQPAPWNLLIELSEHGQSAPLQERLERLLVQAEQDGLIADAALASNQAQCADFWRIRSSVSEGNRKSGMSLVFDIAVPLVQVAAFIERASAAVRSMIDAARIPVVGHLGDGNMHLVIVIEWAHWHALQEPQALLQRLREAVYAIAAELGGTWSAEHGIGSLLLAQMQQYKSPVELQLMRSIKATLDPHGLFNPGKLLPQ